MLGGEKINLYSVLINIRQHVFCAAKCRKHHRLPAYKIVEHFFGLSYLNISENNQVEKSFLESVTFQFHARMLRSHSHSKVMDIFRTLGLGTLSVPPCCIFRVEQIHQSTASERTTRVVNMATLPLTTLKYFCINHGDQSFFLIWNHHKCLSEFFLVHLTTYGMGLGSS